MTDIPPKTLVESILLDCNKKGLAIDQLSCIADGFSEVALDWALLLAAVGTLSMAIIELIKSLFLVRRAYHWLVVWTWFRRCPCHRFSICCWLHPSKNENARRECLELAAGDFRDARGWYDQPSDQLFSQLQSAATVALKTFPQFPNFADFLISSNYPKNFKEESHEKGEDDMSESLSMGDSPEYFLAQRRIDTLRIYSEWRWARLNQLAAMIVSALLLIIFLTPDTKISGNPIVLGILGGMIAPFSKDIVKRLGSSFSRRL